MGNLIILEDSSQSKYGGGQRVTEEICNSLNFTDSIYVIDTQKSKLLEQLKKAQNVNTISLNIQTKSKIIFNTFMILKTLYAFNSIKLNNKILYIVTRKHLFSGILIKLFNKNIKIIYHYHLSTKKNFLWYLYDFLTFLISDYCLFASSFLKEDFLVKRGKFFFRKTYKMFEVPYPPSKWKTKEIIQLQIPITPFKIAYIGKLSKDKGVLLFLEALKYLPKTFNWEAVIAGDGELKETILEIIEKEFPSQNVKYIGNVETNLNFYLNLSVVVVPSFDFIETIGLTALEAIQAGVPVLAASNGNLKNFIKQNFCIEISKNPKEISIKLEEIYFQLVNNNFRQLHNSSTENFKKFYINFISKM